MTMNVIDLLPLIERTTACAPARAWLEAQSPLTPAHQLWATCPKPGWLIWAASHTPALDTEGSLLASRVVSDLAKQVPTYIPDLPNDAARHIRLIEITLADTRLSEAERYAALWCSVQDEDLMICLTRSVSSSLLRIGKRKLVKKLLRSSRRRTVLLDMLPPQYAGDISATRMAGTVCIILQIRLHRLSLVSRYLISGKASTASSPK